MIPSFDREYNIQSNKKKEKRRENREERKWVNSQDDKMTQVGGNIKVITFCFISIIVGTVLLPPT